MWKLLNSIFSLLLLHGNNQEHLPLREGLESGEFSQSSRPTQKCLNRILNANRHNSINFRGIEGNRVRYTFTVTEEEKDLLGYPFPDGVYKPHPLDLRHIPSLITVCEGMTLEIEVKNRLLRGHHNLSIHWHGFFQRGSLYQDGISAITQCPLKAGTDLVYTTKLRQHGTFWFHSHVGAQYTEGSRGAIVVFPEEEDKYPYDHEFTVTLADWYHASYKDNEAWYLSTNSSGIPPYPDSLLMNGHGQYNCTYAKRAGKPCEPWLQKRPVFTLPAATTNGNRKIVKLRLINISGWTTFNFTVEGHKILTIEADGVDTDIPEPADVVLISPGQRFAFLLQRTDFTKDTFLLRADVRKDYLFYSKSIPNINPFPEALSDFVTGVVQYEQGEGNDDTVILPTFEQHDYKAHATEATSLPTSLAPSHPNKIHVNINRLINFERRRAPAQVDVEANLTISFVKGADGISRGSFNDKPFPFPTGKPVLLQALEGSNLSEFTHVRVPKMNQVVQIIVNNPTGGPHPIHLHGHNFHIVGAGKMGDGFYDPAKHPLQLETTIRDTSLVMGKSYLVIRFVANNPGLWALHCHIDWHVSSGMMAVVEEAIEQARTLPIPESARKTCADQGIIM